MQELNVDVCGDYWVNQSQVKTLLDSITSAVPLLVKLNTEGPSLCALGIQQALLEYCARTGTAHKDIYIDHWHNKTEHCVFTRLHQPRVSHFFWMSDSYSAHQLLPWNREKTFAFFVGRATLPRSVMLWHLSQRCDCLLSLMSGSQLKSSRNLTIDTRQEWLRPDEHTRFDDWKKTCDIGSLDSRSVRDQYDPSFNTNAGIAQHYHRFLIEISAETYTRGDGFFPTEKTVRPLALCKALLSHGPRHHLKRLREMGFQTWEGIWDESYDQHEGAQRWRLMRHTIDTIADMDPVEISQKIQHIGEHNRALTLQLANRYRP